MRSMRWLNLLYFFQAGHAVSEQSSQCQEPCACNLSHPTYLLNNIEFCKKMPNEDDSRPCVTPDGTVSMVGDSYSDFPCYFVSGRNLPLQNSVRIRELDVSARCSPVPPVADAMAHEQITCLKTRKEYMEEALLPFDGEDIREDAELREFGKVLQAAGFNEVAIRNYVGHDGSAFADVLWRRDMFETWKSIGFSASLCDSSDQLCHLINLFTIGLPMLMLDAGKLGLKSTVLQRLIALKVLLSNNGLLFSNVQLYALQDAVVFTDIPSPLVDQPVMPLGRDTQALASLVTDLPRRVSHSQHFRILDVCTGSGIQGLAAAAALRQVGITPDVFLVDINPRVKRFVRANLLLNNISGTFIEGDAVGAEVAAHAPFDLFLANTPFWPLNEGVEKTILFRHGGKDGYEVTRRLINSSPQLLKPGGWLQIVTPIYGTTTFNSKLNDWGVGQKATSYFFTKVLSIREGAALWCDGHSAEIQSDCEKKLRELGYDDMSANGLILVRNCPGIPKEGSMLPSFWGTLAGCGNPKYINQTDVIEDWLSCQDPEASKRKHEYLRKT